MKNIITLLKLEFKNKFGDFSPKRGKSWGKLLFTLVFFALILAVAYIGAKTLFRMFDKADMTYEALVILFTLLFLITIITGTSSTIKVLYYKGDNLILMRFPVNGVQIFVSKTLFLFINQCLITLVCALPFLLAYSQTVEVSSVFAERCAIALVFLILIPFFISNILAIPIMHITNKIRNKFALIIIGTSLLVSLVFAVYMVLFDKIVVFLKDSSFSVFSDEVVAVIKNVCGYLIPTKYFADILLCHNELVSYLVFSGLTVASLIGVVLVIAKLYQKTLLKNIEVEGSAFKKKTKMKVKGVFATLFHKEFIQVFRSVNYGFQYFVMACSMPVMVYFCNRLAMSVGRENVGEEISVGLTLLVMLIFMTIITSFASTSISREGKNFYHTKVMPVSIHKQMLVKFIMYMLVSFVANAVCICMLVFLKQMDYLTGLWVFGIAMAAAVTLTLFGMRMDIAHPQFNMSGDGEVVSNSPNTTAVVLIGFVMAMLVGMSAMVLSYLSMDKIMMIISSAICFIFLVTSLLSYFIRLTKAYNRIAK